MLLTSNIQLFLFTLCVTHIYALATANIILNLPFRQLAHLITDVGDTEVMLSGAYS